jgi:hypothetical protein
MYSVRAVRHGLKQASCTAYAFRRGLATTAHAADVAQARKYCLNQLRFCLHRLHRPAPEEPILLTAADMATMRPISYGTSSPGRPRTLMTPFGL